MFKYPWCIRILYYSLLFKRRFFIFVFEKCIIQNFSVLYKVVKNIDLGFPVLYLLLRLLLHAFCYSCNIFSDFENLKVSLDFKHFISHTFFSNILQILRCSCWIIYVIYFLKNVAYFHGFSVKLRNLMRHIHYHFSN